MNIESWRLSEDALTQDIEGDIKEATEVLRDGEFHNVICVVPCEDRLVAVLELRFIKSY